MVKVKQGGEKKTHFSYAFGDETQKEPKEIKMETNSAYHYLKFSCLSYVC
jgi:hypothetical protein